jgi:ubiquinone biosynthesis protein UbiJ
MKEVVMPTDTARSIMQEAQRRRQDRSPDPRLQGMSGSYRFDIEGVGSWRFEVRDGIATITESTGQADCVVRCDEPDFVRIAQGQQNLLTAFLQGCVQIDGDYALAQRLYGFVRVTRERAA